MTMLLKKLCLRRPKQSSSMVFFSQQELDLELFDYVNWFNHIRIHELLGYLTPREYKRKHQAEIYAI